MNPKRILPFEIKTTQLAQAFFYLWIPLLLSLPIFISKEIRIIPYLIAILVMMVVFFVVLSSGPTLFEERKR